MIPLKSKVSAIVVTLALSLVWPAVGVTQSQEESPEWCRDGWFCYRKERAVLVRDKARAFELFCSQIDTPDALPARIAELCDQPSGASRIWIQAEKTAEAQKEASEQQRKANVLEGRNAELEESNTDLRVRVEDLSGDKREARNSRDRWWFVAYGSGGVAMVVSAILLGDIAEWWEL